MVHGGMSGTMVHGGTSGTRWCTVVHGGVQWCTVVGWCMVARVVHGGMMVHSDTTKWVICIYIYTVGSSGEV